VHDPEVFTGGGTTELNATSGLLDEMGRHEGGVRMSGIPAGARAEACRTDAPTAPAPRRAWNLSGSDGVCTGDTGPITLN
jgi:hypothetical protein